MSLSHSLPMDAIPGFKKSLRLLIDTELEDIRVTSHMMDTITAHITSEACGYLYTLAEVRSLVRMGRYMQDSQGVIDFARRDLKVARQRIL